MTADVVAAIVAGVLAAIGVLGIVIPVLPGSLTVGLALLIWALWGGSAWGWWAFGIGFALVAIGLVSGLLLTKRNLGKRQIPQWPIMVGLAAGVVGMFVLPGFGLLVGFVVGLLLAEYSRVKKWDEAVSTSWLALKTLGLGMLIELACAGTAAALLAASIITRFVGG